MKGNAHVSYNNPIIKHKAGLLNLASELHNVSKACKIMGMSRDTFYRYQELVETDGLDGLINRNRRAPNLRNRVDDSTKQAVISYAVDHVCGIAQCKALFGL